MNDKNLVVTFPFKEAINEFLDICNKHTRGINEFHKIDDVPDEYISLFASKYDEIKKQYGYDPAEFLTVEYVNALSRIRITLKAVRSMFNESEQSTIFSLPNSEQFIICADQDVIKETRYAIDMLKKYFILAENIFEEVAENESSRVKAIINKISNMFCATDIYLAPKYESSKWYDLYNDAKYFNSKVDEFISTLDIITI